MFPSYVAGQSHGANQVRPGMDVHRLHDIPVGSQVALESLVDVQVGTAGSWFEHAQVIAQDGDPMRTVFGTNLPRERGIADVVDV